MLDTEMEMEGAGSRYIEFVLLQEPIACLGLSAS